MTIQAAPSAQHSVFSSPPELLTAGVIVLVISLVVVVIGAVGATLAEHGTVRPKRLAGSLLIVVVGAVGVGAAGWLFNITYGPSVTDQVHDEWAFTSTLSEDEILQEGVHILSNHCILTVDDGTNEEHWAGSYSCVDHEPFVKRGGIIR